MSMSRQQLIEDNMKLVHHIIRYHYPNFTNDEDIIQSGMLGLCQGIDNWDESKSKFSTYVGKCILYEIYKEFRSRKKHSGNLSLDYPVKGVDGDTDSFGDMIVGDSDIDFVDIQPFYETLKPREKEMFDLFLSGLTQREVAEKLNVSHTTANTYARRLKTHWRNFYGD